jgi:outer membrane protein OmpA-like peptidoglycan-associated protein
MNIKMWLMLCGLSVAVVHGFAAGKDTVGKVVAFDMKGPVYRLNQKDSLVRGARYVLTGVQFEMDRHILTEKSKLELQRVKEMMDRQPELRIRIEGHVCCVIGVGDALDIDTDEMNLSEARAMEVYRYLLSKGLPAARLSYVGLARKYPLIKKEKTNRDAAINRRLEIRVL